MQSKQKMQHSLCHSNHHHPSHTPCAQPAPLSTLAQYDPHAPKMTIKVGFNGFKTSSFPPFSSSSTLIIRSTLFSLQSFCTHPLLSTELWIGHSYRVHHNKNSKRRRTYIALHSSLTSSWVPSASSRDRLVAP